MPEPQTPQAYQDIPPQEDQIPTARTPPMTAYAATDVPTQLPPENRVHKCWTPVVLTIVCNPHPTSTPQTGFKLGDVALSSSHPIDSSAAAEALLRLILDLKKQDSKRIEELAAENNKLRIQLKVS